MCGHHAPRDESSESFRRWESKPWLVSRPFFLRMAAGSFNPQLSFTTFITRSVMTTLHHAERDEYTNEFSPALFGP